MIHKKKSAKRLVTIKSHANIRIFRIINFAHCGNLFCQQLRGLQGYNILILIIYNAIFYKTY